VVKLNDGRSVDLELFKSDSCGFCRRVYRAIEELGVDGIRIRDTRRDPGSAQDLIRRGGKLQVPCLMIDGKPLYESLDITDWLRSNLGA
jgi:glutaredoxin